MFSYEITVLYRKESGEDSCQLQREFTSALKTCMLSLLEKDQKLASFSLYRQSVFIVGASAKLYDTEKNWEIYFSWYY